MSKYVKYRVYSITIYSYHCRFATRRVMLLEFSQYMENYLWTNFSEKVSCKFCVKKIENIFF